MSAAPAPAPGIVIRAATADDAEDLHAMLLELARDTGLRERIRSKPDDFRKLGFRERPAFQALIAERDGKPVGLSLFFYNFSSWRGELGVYVQDLYVAAEARGTGLGRRLLVETIKRGRTQGATHLRLSVDRDNEGAQKFYRKLGLKLSGSELMFQATGAAFQRLAGESE
ncbi:MAG TPA: GNAT family N-acetyltransferase [Woeseiaceae bacterium]|nr:GNAT family N-acetyltransferase [Woeseiaceae bacterium]